MGRSLIELAKYAQAHLEENERIEQEARMAVRKGFEDLITAGIDPLYEQGISWFCSPHTASGNRETVYLGVMNQHGSVDMSYINRVLRLVLNDFFDSCGIRYYTEPTDPKGMMRIEVAFPKKFAITLAQHLQSKLKN